MDDEIRTAEELAKDADNDFEKLRKVLLERLRQFLDEAPTENWKKLSMHTDDFIREIRCLGKIFPKQTVQKLESVLREYMNAMRSNHANFDTRKEVLDSLATGVYQNFSKILLEGSAIAQNDFKETLDEFHSRVA